MNLTHRSSCLKRASPPTCAYFSSNSFRLCVQMLFHVCRLPSYDDLVSSVSLPLLRAKLPLKCIDLLVSQKSSWICVQIMRELLWKGHNKFLAHTKKVQMQNHAEGEAHGSEGSGDVGIWSNLGEGARVVNFSFFREKQKSHFRQWVSWLASFLVCLFGLISNTKHQSCQR